MRSNYSFGKAFMISLFLSAAFFQLAHAQTKYNLKKGQVVTVSGGKLCGLIKSKWTAVKKAGKKFVTEKDKQRCKTLLVPTALKKSGLAQIPSAAGLLKSRSASASFAVSGTPPVLKNIPTLGAKNVFWTSGFINALVAAPSPSQQQCEEFFAGPNDGQSSGLLGCYAVQGVGYSFQSILDGAKSTCFMKGIPTKANFDGGAVRMVDGSMPGGDITQLFSTPSGSKDRLVKVLVGGFGNEPAQTGFINIHSAKKLAASGNQYGYNLWFCDAGQTTANNYEETSVSLGGEFKYLNVNQMGPNKFRNEITAFLTKVGSAIQFDLSKDRTASSVGEFQGNSFKSFVTLSANNTISSKVKESFNGFGRSNYGVASFTGTGLGDFRVHSAALKDVFFSQSRQTGIEFRDPVYLSAPNTALVAELAKVDIATDSFFSQNGAVNPDFSDKSCSAEADVTLSMDFTNPLLRQVFLTCESDRLENMDFCRSQDMFQAQSTCSPQ
ncbi:MAG: hypothetical protein ACK5GN_01865 [Pseudomonadota bacterium]|jgi:hypothetical protein